MAFFLHAMTLEVNGPDLLTCVTNNDRSNNPTIYNLSAKVLALTWPILAHQSDSNDTPRHVHIYVSDRLPSLRIKGIPGVIHCKGKLT